MLEATMAATNWFMSDEGKSHWSQEEEGRTRRGRGTTIAKNGLRSAT